METPLQLKPLSRRAKPKRLYNGDDIEEAGSFGAIPTPPKEKENRLPF